MGYYCFGPERPDKHQLSEMFSLLETRGKDASGYAYVEKNNLVVNKAPIKSGVMITTPEWEKLKLPQSMIFHTRLKTQGDPKNNINNHPLFNKKGLAIVHNGMIINDNEIFTRKIKRDGEVDSEAILVALSQKGKDKISKVFNLLEGSFAIAAIDVSNPEDLILIRKDNPIELYFDSYADILYFCSERWMMQKSLAIKVRSQRGFNLGEEPFHYYEVENNHGLIINKNGLNSYKKYYPKRTYRSNIFRESFIEDTVECPFCLNETMYFPGNLHNYCEYCGTPIEFDDIYI